MTTRPLNSSELTTVLTPDNDGWVHHLVDRWVVMTHGGRAITSKLATRVHELESIADGSRPAEAVWRWSIDPATSTGDPAQRRAAWQSIAEHGAAGQDESIRSVRLTTAEAMLEWPIYRFALTD